MVRAVVLPFFITSGVVSLEIRVKEVLAMEELELITEDRCPIPVRVWMVESESDPKYSALITEEESPLHHNAFALPGYTQEEAYPLYHWIIERLKEENYTLKTRELHRLENVTIRDEPQEL